MAKEKGVKLYQHLNEYLVTAYQANYRVHCVLQQMLNAEQVNVSAFTENWFNSKHNAYADHRYDIVSRNRKALEKEVEYYNDECEKSKNKLVDELQKYFADKKFEDVISDYSIIDADVIELYQKQATGQMLGADGTTPETGFIESFVDYIQKNSSAKLAQTTEKVHDNIISDIDASGYKNFMTQRNETADVKVVESDFVNQLHSFAKEIIPSYKKELLKAQLETNKLAKKLKKDPNNIELASLLDMSEVTVQFCEDTLVKADYLMFVANILNDRMVAVNDRKYDLSDKIVEGLADFGFMVPSVSKGEENRPKFNTMYMGTNEIENLIGTTKEFPEAGLFTQYLSSKIGVPTVIPAHDFEIGKLTMQMLKDMHDIHVEAIIQNANANGNSVSDAEVKTMATKPELAKFLQFETPFGKVWFDGENCVTVKDSKVVPFNELCKYVLNPNDGKLYYLQTDAEIKPGSVTLVNNNSQPTSNGEERSK